jgi:competence protein ComEA
MTLSNRTSSLLDVARRVGLYLALAAAAITTSAAVIEAPSAEAGPAATARAMKAAAAAERSRARKAKKEAASKPLQGVINVNLASEKQLQRLPGIGPGLARRIVEWREKRGKLERVRDLRRVKGIGVKKLKKMEEHVRVSGPTTIR